MKASTAADRAILVVLAAIQQLGPKFGVRENLEGLVNEASAELHEERAYTQYATAMFFRRDTGFSADEAIRAQLTYLLVYGVCPNPDKLKATLKSCLLIEITNQMDHARTGDEGEPNHRQGPSPN